MDFKALLNQIGLLYQNLSLRQRIVAIGSVVLVVGFIVFLSFYKSGSKSDTEGYSVLFENVSASDSALIIEQLEKDGIKYKLKNESTILVPSEIVYKERIAIASLGIPKSSKVGFEIFDKQEFGATDFDQRVKYLRALEGELARTIEALMPIENAKIHIAIPKDSVFTERQIPPSASIVLAIKEGTKLTTKQITGIKNLVASSITNMSAERVKVVDQNGIPLGEEEIFESELVAQQMRYKREFEANYEEKIKKVLAPIVGGNDKVVAKVTIDFNFAREDSVSEVYDPNSVPRSEQNVEEKREGRKPSEVKGVPGAVSNIGPVEGIEEYKATELYEKSSTTTNYEISKKVTNVKDEFATIRRLSAAVVVDGKYEEQQDEDGKAKLTFVPLDAASVANISEIVKQSIGFNAQRGDEVTVSNFEFKPLYPQVTQKTGFLGFMSKAESYLGPFGPVFKYLLVAIILFVFYKKVIVPFSEKMLEEPMPEDEYIAKEEEDFDEQPEDTLEKFKQARKKVEEQLGITDDFDEEGLKYEVLLEKMKTITAERTEEVANLLQSMIKSDSDFSIMKDMQ